MMKKKRRQGKAMRRRQGMRGNKNTLSLVSSVVFECVQCDIYASVCTLSTSNVISLQR